METCYEPIDVRCAAPSVHSPVRRRPGLCRGGRAGWLSALLACLSLQAGTITWDGGGDGASWNDPLNWSGDTLPGQTDDAVIDVPGDPTIVLSGSVNVRSLNCEEAFELSGSLRLYGGNSTINGATTLTGSLHAYDGAVLNAPNLTSMEVGGWRSLHAAGPGSVIELANLSMASIAGGGRLHLETLNGGEVRLPSLNSFVHAGYGVVVEASGAGQVDLSGLVGPVSQTSLIYEDNGTILLPGALAMTGSSITLYGPDTPTDFSWLTGFEGSLYAYDGAVLNAPNLTSLESEGSQYLHAEGVGSVIELAKRGFGELHQQQPAVCARTRNSGQNRPAGTG
ncbi:MAG: hypothetical protein H7A47_01935 [Verrucomicrobiales bacterium]|nr:hypothetical protein [Verrucomicrobiales bacterium]